MTADSADLIRSMQRNYFEMYPAEASATLEEMPSQHIAAVIENIPEAVTIKIWERLSPGLAGRVFEFIQPDSVTNILENMDPNYAARILQSMTETDRDEYLGRVPEPFSSELKQAMSHLPDTAGALMGTNLVFYTPELTVSQALKRLRTHRAPSVRMLFIVDNDNRLQGMVSVQELALAGGQTLLRDLMKGIMSSVVATTSREEMVDIFEKFRVTELPVVDLDGRFIGIVRHHALIDAAKQEGSADIQTMVGVSKDERALSLPFFAVKKRLPWLQINLVTAFLAASVVGLFESTIAQYTALAVLLPVVAGQSGNTGAQALAVTMRGLALREIWPRHWRRIVMKEFSAGLGNGIAVALTTMLGVYIWSQSPGLCLIIGVSMVLSMVIASVSGGMIPILLVRAGQDPATSSSIILTTVTDVMGFFSFLGIATMLITLL